MLCTDYHLCALQPYPAEFGQVASVKAQDTRLVKLLLEQNLTPVICSIGLSDKGALYNINADEVAAALALAFKCPLVFFSDVKGVLDAEGQVIAEIDEAKISELLAQQVINEGMAVKVKNAVNVAKQSGAPVFIASIFDEVALANLSSLKQIGTTLRA